MGDNSKKPGIRFKGFTDDWEQRKWIDSIDISTEMVDPTSSEYADMPHIAPGNIESFTGRILDNVKTVKEEQLISGKFRFRPDDVVYGKINPQLGKYFYASVDGLTSADAYVFKGKNGTTQNFLFSLLQTNEFFKYSVSVSKRSGMPKINRDELNAYRFFSPNEEEQDKIGDLLLGIDNLITLHQRKYDKLVMIKKSMLEKMFPKNGQTKPEIRFSGFTDDWEQRKLGECFSERIKSMPDGELISVTINDGIKKFSELGRHDNSNEDKSKYKKVCIGDIAYNSMRMWQGASGYSPYEGIVSPAYTVLSPKANVFSRCIAYQFKLPQMTHIFQINSQGITSDNWNLKYPALSEIRICISKNVEEQKQVAGLFVALDHLITLHQRELEKLNKIKLSMLDKMFV